MDSGFSSSDHLELGKGLIFGNDSGFSSGLKEATRQLGISHLTAASGANISLVEGFFQGGKGLGFWGWQFTRVILIGSFWHLAEQSGSLWRALVMWSASWIFSLEGKPLQPAFSLGLTIMLTVLMQKEYLGSGFWLSSLAVTGLIFSRKFLPGEKNAYLFTKPENGQKPGSKVSQKLGTIPWSPLQHKLQQGTWVFFFVSLWLWTFYQEFEPWGVVMTVFFEFLLHPYIRLSLGVWLFPDSFLGELQGWYFAAVVFCIQFWQHVERSFPLLRWVILIFATWLLYLQMKAWWSYKQKIFLERKWHV